MQDIYNHILHESGHWSYSDGAVKTKNNDEK